jgi:ATP-dependent DNA helicase DinG
VNTKLGDLEELTREVFFPEGPLSRALPGYETRGEQERLADLIARTIATNDRLLAEAGTGTGKSLAYLIPIVLAVDDDTRAVISTHTINLQDQLLMKDLPLAQRAAARKDIKVERVLGRGNYLCRRKLAGSMVDLFAGDDETMLKLLKWAESDPEGIRGNLTFRVPFWERVASSSTDCPGPACLHFKECYYQLARRREREAHILIVNHALLCADLILKQAGGARLDEYQILVVDEAHALPSVAVDAFAKSWSLRRMLGVLDQLMPAHTQGYAQRWEITPERRTDLFRLTMELRNTATEQQRVIQASQGGRQGRILERNFAQNLIAEPTNALVTLLVPIASGAQSPQKDEMLGMVWQLNELAGALEINLVQSLGNYVYYAEGLDDSYTLIAKPLIVSDMLHGLLWDEVGCAVGTSATLAVGKRLEFVRKQLGMADSVGEIILGGFDYARQLVIYVPRDLPDPNSRDFDAVIAQKLVELGRITPGGMLCLFTSYRALESTWLQAHGELEEMGFAVYKQNDESREKLVRRMREHGRMALFGTASFWEGIDVPGAALSTLAICRLPFTPPDDPYEQAMQEFISERGGNSFLEWTVPQAVMRLRQGVGRLIRRRDDTGVVAIFDSRLHSKSYGRIFMESLPPGRLVESLADISIGEGKKLRHRRKHIER